MKKNKKELTLVLSIVTAVIGAVGLVFSVVRLLSARSQPIHRSFQNDNVLRRGKYAGRHTSWPLR